MIENWSGSMVAELFWLKLAEELMYVHEKLEERFPAFQIVANHGGRIDLLCEMIEALPLSVECKLYLVDQLRKQIAELPTALTTVIGRLQRALDCLSRG